VVVQRRQKVEEIPRLVVVGRNRFRFLLSLFVALEERQGFVDRVRRLRDHRLFRRKTRKAFKAFRKIGDTTTDLGCAGRGHSGPPSRRCLWLLLLLMFLLLRLFASQSLEVGFVAAPAAGQHQNIAIQSTDSRIIAQEHQLWIGGRSVRVRARGAILATTAVVSRFHLLGPCRPFSFALFSALEGLLNFDQGRTVGSLHPKGGSVPPRVEAVSTTLACMMNGGAGYFRCISSRGVVGIAIPELV